MQSTKINHNCYGYIIIIVYVYMHMVKNCIYVQWFSTMNVF